jgi:hypothetical protein
MSDDGNTSRKLTGTPLDLAAAIRRRRDGGPGHVGGPTRTPAAGPAPIPATPPTAAPPAAKTADEPDSE